MSSEKHSTERNQQPDWKFELEKNWKMFYRKSSDYFLNHKDQFSLAKISGIVGGAATVIWLSTGVYIIDEGNRGVITRFGAYSETTTPGPHWHLPAPIEKVSIVNVEQQRFIEVGYRDSRGNKSANVGQESLMLTTDENIINVRLAVQYQINNARDYLFNVRDNEDTLKQLTESVERAVIGSNNMDYVLTEGRSEIVAEIKRDIQTAMDDYQAGIIIASVNLQDAQPPEEVQGAFEDAIRAREDKQRLINEAEAYSNEIIPKARGAAARLLLEAEAYEAEKVAKAKGDTQRFEQLLVEYEKAPAITRKRLFLEAREKLFSSTNKVIVDAGQNAPQLYMPLQNPVSNTVAANKSTALELPGEPVAVDKNDAAKTAANNLRPSRSRP
ncbi:MAG: FtsH protease activity modulator HflK [Methylobacter sp.]|nr:FtsH protease activity modulator HflK [Methylobacter sp.]MDP2100727.1 FtsH protease activity modulator HflK [Methylobacter sp.]MDP2427807.1 FtsH protease activity modulator HflK [Methylobacter sp.]MDP3053893.1 FtsH protease activity modulator HflK [Methylobacter sp.]MDP3360540.1 FtsH protease activity modulator HflK [Methylobacter sp.]